ncbi:MAG: serine kinase [Bacteroidales bacterium]|nr:serine kinase [Bacteroidales bacterium]
MKISDLMNVDCLQLTALNEVAYDGEFEGAYAGDLLSDVMGNAKSGQIWITMQTHKNVAAIAGLKDLSAVIIVGNLEAAQDMIEQCTEEDIPVFVTPLRTYEVSGVIYALENK